MVADMSNKKKNKHTTNQKKHHENFLEGNINALFDTLAESIDSFAEGPEVKNQATYDYEYITKMLLIEKKAASFSIKNGEYWIEFANGKKFNFSEVLKNFNANHLKLDPQYHEMYMDFLKKQSIQKPKKDPNFTYGEDTWPTEEYFNNRDEKKDLANLSYAEKCAINIYTQKYYSTMNEMLRGETAIHADSETFQEEMLEVLFHNAFCSTGLNKVGNTEVKNAFRVDSTLPPEIVKARIASMDQENAVLVEKGFVSSSKDKPINIAGTENPLFKAKEDQKRKGMVYTIFSNMIGKDISAISNKSDEREILIPPNTQVRYRQYKEEEGAVYFYADLVRTPVLEQKQGQEHALSNEELSLEKKLSEKIAHGVDPNEVAELIKKVKELKKDYNSQKWKLHTNSDREKQIAKLMQMANNVAEDNSLTSKQKMVKITESLLVVRNEIVADQRKKPAIIKLFQSKSRLVKSIDKSLDTLSQDTKQEYNTHQSRQKLFEYENPIFSDRMKSIVDHVHSEYLSKPYKDKATHNTGEEEYAHYTSTQTVYRPNHGTVHTLRGALMVAPVAEAFRKKYGNSMDMDDIKRMQVAMLFSTVGRQCEDNFKYAEYRNDSALAFQQYVKENARDLFTDKQIKEYTSYLKWYTDPNKTKNHPKADIMRICHSLDVLRYEPDEDKFNGYCKNELTSKLGEASAESLVSYSRQCLLATGNRVRTGEDVDYQPELFIESSLDPQKALAHLKRVEPPRHLDKAKFNMKGN